MNKRVGRYIRRKFHKKRWQQFAFIMACIVVFCTTYALLLPAVTLEKTADCNLEEHQHEKSCYENQLICGNKESDGHRHTDSCYRKVLVCGKEVHVHSEDCFHGRILKGTADENISADNTAEEAGQLLLDETEDIEQTAVNEPASGAAMNQEIDPEAEGDGLSFGEEAAAESESVSEQSTAEEAAEEANPLLEETDTAGWEAEISEEQPADGEAAGEAETESEENAGEEFVGAAETESEEPSGGETVEAETESEEPSGGETVEAETESEEPSGEETGAAETESEEPSGEEIGAAEETPSSEPGLTEEQSAEEETAGETETFPEETANVETDQGSETLPEETSDEETEPVEENPEWAAETSEEQSLTEDIATESETLSESTTNEETGPVEENPEGEAERIENQSSAEEPAVETETLSEETAPEEIPDKEAGATTEQEQVTSEIMTEDGTELAQEAAAQLACQGPDYEVTVTSGVKEGIPKDASLSVSEIMPETPADNTDADYNADTELTYEEYVSRTEEVLGIEKDSGYYIRLFDIKIVDAYGEKIKIQAPVNVKIRLTDQKGADISNAQVVHFADETNEADIAEETNGTEKTDSETLSESETKTATTPSRNAKALSKAKNINKAAKAKKEKKGDVIQDVTVETGVLPEDGTTLSFETEGFSVFALVGTTIEKTVLASDGHNYRITATYGAETGIPEDADLAVEEITEVSSDYDKYVSKTENALGMEEGSAGYIRLFDIKIVDEKGEKIQPTEGSTVDVKIELADAQSVDLNVVHFIDGIENGDVVEASILDAGDGKSVSFVADGFSIYAITDEPGENARIGYRFWYHDGTQNALLSTQYFRYKDVHPEEGTALTINEPGIPDVDSTTWNRIFRGWSKTGFDDDDSNLITVEALNAELNGLAESDYSEGTFVDLFANLKDVYYVTYVDVNPNNILATEIVPKAETGTTTFNVKPETELRPTIDSDTVLQGWYDINNPDTVYTPGQGNVAVDESITLYPKIEGGYWLIFNDNDLVWDESRQEYVSGGASFTPPAFYLDSATQEPAEPVWGGYEFGGWYTDRECTTPFTFGENLSHDTTVYAKWIPSASQYRVIIWKQRTSDSAGTLDDGKNYDYVTSFLDESVVTGQTVTLNASYKNIYGSNGTSTDADKAYFIYNDARTDQSVVVKADGTSVLNVYYDRKPVTLNFYTWDYGYTAAANNNGTQYGLVDGQYVQLTRSGNNPNYTWTYVTGTEYVYNLYNGTSEGYYFIPDGNGGFTSVYLYRNNGRWYRTRTGSWWSGYDYSNEYTGNVYTQAEQNITAVYTGTRYTRNNSRSWVLYETMTGLYGSTFAQNGYTWPTAYWWYDTGSSSGSTSGTRTTVMTAFLPTDVNTTGNTITKNFYGNTSSGSARINFYVQELDGSYTLREYVTSGGGTFYITDKYIGYHAAQYRANNSGNWKGAGTPNSSGYYNNGSGVSYSSQLDIRFDLNNYTLTFYTNNGANQGVDYSVPYSKPLADYAGQNPGQRAGHYFLGWFADPGCTEPFDFSQTMPDNNIAVYGKWRLERFRIVIEPGATNVYMGSQATRFRLDYDERIDGGLLETATRAGYILDGWYTDPDFTNRFLFSSPVNTSTPGVDMTYHDSPSWAAARAAYGDDTEAYDNVRGILHLYAKWIPDPNSTGINVVYDPGDAAIYDSLGALLTTVPIDTHMYGFDGTSTAREAPSNYNDLYTFKYWEATTEDGETVHFYPGDPITLADLIFTNPVYDEGTGELIRKTVTLRAVYDQTGDPSRMTHITYDGNTFTDNIYSGTTREMKGETRDGTHRYSVTLDESVNETITLPSADDFYLEGWELVGWSFTEGTYAEQEAAATPEAPNFVPGQKVAADNLIVSDLNDQENTLYAMWQPKEYNVTVRQVVEEGVPVNNYAYAYKRGVENNIESATEQVKTLTGSNTSFTEEDFEYYERTGHVIRITTPTPTDDTYDVRVNAVVTKDDGTTEILNPTAAGNYQILGDVVITYTYSLKVPVKMQKRDATNHSKTLTGAEFVLTPVEFNTSTQRWENAGSGRTITIDAATIEQYLQEGTYRITEIDAPDQYAKISEDLYLTVKKDESFTLFTANGGTVDSSVANLDNTGRILTIYDNPVRTVTLTKLIEGGGEDTFPFKVTVFNSDGVTRLAGYTIGEKGGNALTTNNIGEVMLSLGDQESVELNIPHGSKITVEETQNSQYRASYTWNGSEAVEGNVFGSEPVQITTDSTLKYTNRHALQKLRIKKIRDDAPDDAPDGLAGAVFSLTAKQGTTISGFSNLTDLTSMDGTTDASNLGFLLGNDASDPTLFMLPNGTYTLTESGVPDYYAGLDGAVTLTVSADGITAAAASGDESLISMSNPDSNGIYTLTITNTRKLATVTIIKKVTGTDTDQDAKYHFTSTGLTETENPFDLHGRHKDAEGDTPEQKNTKVYENIPYGTVFSVTEDSTYTDFDTTIAISNEETPVTTPRLTTGNVTVDGDVTITYTNTRKKQPVKVFKFETGTSPEKPLSGAVFSLTGPEGSDVSYTGLTTNSDGYLVYEENIVLELPVNTGTYTLTETQAPNGYQIIGDGNTTFTVSPGLVTGAVAETELIEGEEIPSVVFIIKIQNSAGVELPSTGGPGTSQIHLLGIMLAGLAGTALVIRKRRKTA